MLLAAVFVIPAIVLVASYLLFPHKFLKGEHVGIDDWSDLVVQDPEFYRPAEVDYLRGDCSKANNELGWTPKHSFEDLVKLMVDYDTK